MAGIVNYRGDNDFPFCVALSSSDNGLLFSLGSHSGVYCPSKKRSRITGPCTITSKPLESPRPSIDVLPNECLFEIFKRLQSGQERSSAACVSKRWLTVLSSVRSHEFHSSKSRTDTVRAINYSSEDDDGIEVESDGYLTRCVEGKKATDVRLASIAVGTSSRGGLGKLSIRGNNSSRGVTNYGLSAIARGCPSLRVLSLWNLPSIGDEGLIEIARECHGLEKLDLSQCPSISDKGLVAIAESSPNLTSLTIESCPKIGNDGLRAIAKYCPKLQSITLKDCALVGDEGIHSLLTSSSNVLNKVKLQGLNITDYSIAVIGHYGKSITSLVLGGLENVSEKGFWVMSNVKGLHVLSSLTVYSCKGITDLSIEAVGRGCPNLKHVCLRKCYFVSDNGLIGLGKASSSLESLQLEECNRISHMGVLAAVSCSKSKLKSVSLVKCMGIKDISTDFPVLSPCESLRSLSIISCPGFGSTCLAMIGKLCPKLHHLDFSGLCGITDHSLIPLLESCNKHGLSKVNLSGCSNLTDRAIFALARFHGQTLQTLNLNGCRSITDQSLKAIAYNCPSLNDLDVAKCWITDSGVVSLAQGAISGLRVLSLSGCSMITSASIPALEKWGSNMEGLNLKNCSSLSGSAIDSLSENMWRCDVLA